MNHAGEFAGGRRRGHQDAVCEFHQSCDPDDRSVAQALRPYPQYGTINTTNSGGDKTGRSMYHAGVLKLTQRLTDGFLFQGSYTYSKLMTNADAFSGSTGSMDAAQPELEYSIGRLDQPHSIKLNTVFELPLGPGRRWLNRASRSHVLGGWRIAAVQSYSSGLPIGVTTRRAAADLQRHEPSERDGR